MNLESLLTENIKKAVKDLYEIDLKDIRLEHPENEQFGDYASSVSLSLGKDLKRLPIEIAKELAQEISSYNLTFESDKDPYPVFASIEAIQPGFINFKLSQEWLKQQMVDVFEKGDKYGSSDIGDKKTIVVEYSQPNTNKPMHVGHSRNNFLGSSLANILGFVGYKVIKSNYVGDIGIHICKSMLMYQKYGEGREPGIGQDENVKPDHFVGEFYRMYEEAFEKDPSIENEASDMLRKWESGDEETLQLWEKMNAWVYKGWEETYKEEGVSFDTWSYESEEVNIGKEMVEDAVKKGVAVKDGTGAVIAKLEEYGLPDKVLLRSDGTSIYATKDLQLAKNSYEKFKFEKRLYVVDSRQSDYLKTIFKVLELMGYDWALKLHHISYGFVTLPEGVMSSRLGNTVNADDVYKKLVDLEQDEVRHSLKEVSDLEDTSKKVALAAFRYGMLKVDPKQDIVFDYDKVTKFEGNTGPYLMYSYARAKSILEKAGVEEKEIDFNLKLFGETKLEEKEVDILRSIYKFSEIVLESADSFTPHVIANYLYDLSQRFNSFYADVPVLNAEGYVRGFRLALVKCMSQVLKNGLHLLGIDVVEKM